MPYNGIDFISLVLSLKFQNHGVLKRPLPSWWGRAAQQAFLRIIGNRDASLAKELHPGANNSERVPYTASSLIGFDPDKPDLHKTHLLRFTSIHPHAARMLLEEAQSGALQPGRFLELDSIPFRIQDSDWQSSDWAYTDTWPRLLAKIDRIDLNDQDKITLEFASPTFFKRNKEAMNETLPLPELVFDQISKLASKWTVLNAAFDAKDYAARRMRIDGSVGLRLIEFEARRTNAGKSVLRKGALGQAVYRFLEPQPDAMHYFYKLAYFGFFAGVGKGTTTGCGQVRVMH